MGAVSRMIRLSLGAVARACGLDHPPLPAAGAPSGLSPHPDKTGYPPSKCYGSEISCHSDSW